MPANARQSKAHLTRRSFLRTLGHGAAAIGAAPWLATAAGPAASRPNVILIVSDDHGYTDYGFMGHPVIRTPNLDRLASESVQFVRGYVPTALCCPSLGSMLTGLYPHQHGFTGNDPIAGAGSRQPWLDRFFPHPQLPAILRDAGYLTLQTGKYWYGDPQKSGFTDDMGATGRHGGDGLAIGRKTMAPVFSFIDRARQMEKPFFVWYAPMMPHTPHTPPERLLAKYRSASGDGGNAKYFAMVEWFDETCGQLLAYLDQHGLRDNTIVAYIADNGIQTAGSGFRGAKLSPWELGVRQPILIRWPARLAPRRDETHLASSIDLAPTILRACGLPAPASMAGIDLLDERAVAERPAIFLENFTHDMVDAATPQKSLLSRGVLAGPWKLLVAHEPDERAPRRVARLPEPVMLFHVVTDPKETTNLAGQEPDKVRELTALLDRWWRP